MSDVKLQLGWYKWPDLTRLPVQSGSMYDSSALEIVDDSLLLKRIDDG